jgi:N-sulfoglucosamine sulfohydrolase
MDRVNKWRLTAFWGILLTLLLQAGAPAQPKDVAAKPKNVVLFIVDDQGFQAGCFGNDHIQTPGIDRLAREGTRFTRAYCTTASCSASRSVLLSGLYNHAIGHYGHAHGYNHFSSYETVRSLPILLANAGYRTCSIGKYHLAPESVYHFETYRNEGIQGARNSVRMAQNAKAWLAEADARPFFLYFCTSDPHRGGGPGGFSNYPDDPAHYPGVKPIRYEPEEVVVPPWLPDLPETRQELAEYYQAISRLDLGVSGLLDALEETGHLNDTLFIFLSDNGPPFPGAKTCLYEPGSKLPLIVRLPDQKERGITSDAIVCWADITPTVLDYCGVEPKPAPPVRPGPYGAMPGRRGRGKTEPYQFHGRSFLSVVEQEQTKGWDEIYASHTFHEITMYYPMRSLINRRYKYIVNLAHQLPYPFASDLYASPTWQAVLKGKHDLYGQRTVYAYLHRQRHELYDLANDPHEVQNLANDPEHQQTLLAMQKKLKTWQQSTRDPWFLKWEYE